MPPEVIQFWDVTVDLRRMSVSRAGQPVSLEPKTFDVLRYLIEHRDRLVTKEELLDAAWKDTFVTPNVLTRAIAQLRKALGDDAFEARYIETVAKRGYRFIAPLEIQPGDTAPIPTTISAAVSPTHRSASIGVVVLVLVSLLGAVGLALFVFRDRAPAEPPATSAAPSLRRLTIGSQSYSFPSISPDGRTVAYSSDLTGAMEIYTAGFARGSRELALTSDGGQNMYAEWSPDGQWIAYHSRKKGGIWIVPSGGGAARQVVDFGSQASWTPDGERLVFTSDAGGMAAQSSLWMVHRDGTDRSPLTKLGAPRGGHSKPSVSPDGRFVAFAVSQGHIGTDVWTVPINGGDVVRLGPGAAPRFSRDGRAVYWVGRTLEGNDVLMRAAIDERGGPASTPEHVQQFPGTFIGGFSIARDGTSVLSLFQGSANLWSVDVPARGAPAPPVPLTFDDVRNTHPRHSRDGRIVFHQLAVGQPPTTWLIDEDGKNRESLTVGLRVGVWGPQWHPDNQRVLVTVAGLDRKPWFAWLDPTTRQMSKIALSPEGLFNPHLSPDGREIAFHVIDEGGVINVWRQAVDGGPRKQVTFDNEAMTYPVWSPDGQSIAVEIKRGDHTHIGIVPKDGGPVEPVVTERGQSWPHSWAPDNDRIAFAGSRNGVWNVYTVSRTTKEIRQLTNFTSMEGYVRYPSWSLTRPAIVFERAEQRGSLWSMKLP